ncbi:MAG: hypothetical protein WC501_02840 [Candidatus Micrarchaeia archaeon]
MRYKGKYPEPKKSKSIPLRKLFMAEERVADEIANSIRLDKDLERKESLLLAQRNIAIGIISRKNFILESIKYAVLLAKTLRVEKLEAFASDYKEMAEDLKYFHQSHLEFSYDSHIAVLYHAASIAYQRLGDSNNAQDCLQNAKFFFTESVAASGPEKAMFH